MEAIMTYIIAEAGVDHEGNINRLMALFNTAVLAKVDAFKIQYYASGFQGEHRELPWIAEEHLLTIHESCGQHGLDFIITPHDEWAMNLMLDNPTCDRIKIGSGDWDLLAMLDPKSDVIISTGGKTKPEILHAMTTFQNADFLHCVSEYPTKPGHANLNRIKHMRHWMSALDCHGKVGYSDHTVGKTASVIAVTLGAKILEKHLTLDRNTPGRNDTICSLQPHEWLGFRNKIKLIEDML